MSAQMPPDNLNEIGVLKRREIEARILMPVLTARLRVVLERPPNASRSMPRSFKNAATKKTMKAVKRKFAIKSRLVS